MKATSILSTAIAILAGVIVLLGAFLAIPVLQTVRTVLLGWALIVAAAAGLVALLNLIFGVHGVRAYKRAAGSGYSWLVLISFIVVVVLGFVLGSDDSLMQGLIQNVVKPIEASLMAVATASLVLAGARLFRKRSGVPAVLFFISALIFVLLGSGLLAAQANLPFVKEALSVLESLPLAGARGILIGMGLGALLAGLRVLMGADRPYSG
jgi:hypothetical protein